MRHMILLKTDGEPDAEAQACKDRPAMVALLDRLRRDGVLVATEALRSTRSAARVRKSAGGDLAVVDGPFAEAKELVGGFVLVRADRAAAVGIAREILTIAAPGVTAEVREVAE